MKLRGLPNCPSGCRSCLSSARPNQCWKKHVIYQITCNKCGKIYIGETGRTIRSRILEHQSRSDSTVFQHMISHNDINPTDFSWRILFIMPNSFNRLILESISQNKYAPDQLMDGNTTINLPTHLIG